MLELVAARLETLARPPLMSIAGGEDLAALAEGVAPPDMSAFVVPYAQEASANERATGGTLQRVRVVFLVAVCIRRYGDAKGGARIAITETIDRAIEGGLLGWQPSDDWEPIELVGVRSQPAKNSVLWHVSTWATGRYAEE